MEQSKSDEVLKEYIKVTKELDRLVRETCEIVDRQFNILENRLSKLEEKSSVKINGHEMSQIMRIITHAVEVKYKREAEFCEFFGLKKND